MIAVVAIALLQVVPARAAAVPFGVGETLEYSGGALFGAASANGTLKVVAIDTIRGIPEWRFNFRFGVSAPFYKNRSDFTSWTGVNDFISRRVTKSVHESGFDRDEDYAIYGDSGFYRNQFDGQTTPTPTNAIDDVALFYYIRTLPLTVGKPVILNNFFRKSRNPVIINVLRRESCELPEKVKAMCLVLNPIVEDEPNGLFMKSRNAKLWITDDARRIPWQIQAKVHINVTLTLKKITPGK